MSARPSAKPIPVPSPGTGQEILLAASKLFLERGYKGTSVEAIADAVGMTPGALYWHYKSKQEILFTFLRTTIDNVVDQIREDEYASPTERLRHVAHAHVTSQLTLLPPPAQGTTHTFTPNQLISALPAELQEELQTAQDTYLHRITALLRDGVERGEFQCEHVTPTAFAIVNMCEHVNIWFRPAGSLKVADLADLYGELAVRMASARDTPGTKNSKGTESNHINKKNNRRTGP